MSDTPAHTFTWGELAFGSKKPLGDLHAIFIAAPRELSTKRLTQLVKQHLPSGNLVIGIADEDYVWGFEGQPQFKTLRPDAVQPLVDKIAASSAKHQLYTLHYAQRDLQYLLEKLDFQKVVLVNGSWKYSFHTQTPFYVLVARHIPYEFVSPFTDEAEAKAYETAFAPYLLQETAKPGAPALTEAQMLAEAGRIAKLSFDYSFQTGVVLGRKTAGGYQPLLHTFNPVVPYQTYAMHHGAAREQHFSPPHDLNYYDTVHAEVECIIQAGKQGIGLEGTSLFINLLPCPACARMLSQTGITEFIYTEDHSDGYAVAMLEAAGKIVRRIASR